MNQTSVLTFSNIYCKTLTCSASPYALLIFCYALYLRSASNLYRILTSAVFLQGNMTSRPPSLESREWVFYQWISLEMLQCCFRICQCLYKKCFCIKCAQSQTIKNSTLKQSAVSIWIGLRAWEITWAPEITMDILFRWFFLALGVACTFTCRQKASAPLSV